MRNVWKRSLSLLLAMVMVFGILPVNTRATEADLEPAGSVSVMEPSVEEAVAAEPAAQQTDAVSESTAAQSSSVLESAQGEGSTEEDPQEPEGEKSEIVTQTVTVAPDASGLPSDAELFAAYAERKFFGGIMLLGTAAGDELNGDIKLVYDAVVPIIKQIANGERASTTITLGATVGENIPEVKLTFSDGAFTGDRLNADLTSLLNALLADLPYELYWFDKVTGVSMSTVTSVGSGAMFVQLDFRVSGYYQDGNACTVDTAKTGVASKAVENAQAVVDQYAEKSDYEKLVAYKEWICDAVSYNSSAAESGNFSADADPWQLIYVFDGDSSTNVVCEGYSKAFQYLCDLSDFQEDILCYSVTGLMGGGGHMWNIVDIEGAHYLVDVTNSDSGTIGEDGSLFLVGGERNADGSYTFGFVTFTYSSDTISLWEDAGILTLALTNYTPSAQSEDDETENEAQDRLEEALQENIDNRYTMTESVTLTRDLTVDLSSSEDPNSNLLSIPSGITLTVPSGVTLTVDTVIMLQGGSLVIEDGGKLVLNARIWVHNGSGSGGVLTVAAGSTVLFGDTGSVVLEQDGSRIDGTIPKEQLVTQSTVTNLEELETALALDLEPYAYHNVFVSGSFTVTEALTIPEGAYVNLNASSEVTIGTEENPVTLVNNGGLYVLPGSQMVITPDSMVQNNGQLGNFEGTLTGTVTGNPVIGDAEGVNRGACGVNLVWSFDDATDTLIITETSEGAGGAMASYATGEAPWYELRDSITAIDVRAGTSIGDYSTFADLGQVTSISLPKTLKDVSVENFNSMYKLETIAFPNGNDNGLTVVDGVSVLKTEGEEVILTATARNISNYTIPDSVTRIGISGIGVLGLSTLTIPESVTQLDSYALQHCSSLTAITFTGSAPTIGENAFWNIEAAMYYPANDDTWTDVITDTYGGTVTWVSEGDAPIDNTCGVNLVWSFDDATGTLIITETSEGAGGAMLTYDAGEAPWFDLRDSITAIDVRAGTSLGDHSTFYGLYYVTSISLPKTLKSVTVQNFNSQFKLETIAFPNGNDNGLSVVDGVSVLKTEGDKVTLTATARNLSNYTIPDSVTCIGINGIGVVGLSALTIPGSVTQLNNYALQHCSSIKTITFTGSAPTIGKTAFHNIEATVYYPVNDDTWNEVITDTYGGTITWSSSCCVAISEENPTQLMGGKSVTLKASLYPSNPTKTSIVWSLKDPDDSAFVSLTAAGKLTAKAVTERHDITVVAAAKDGQAVPAELTITLIPMASAVEISREGLPVTGETIEVDLNSPALTDIVLTAAVLPEDAEQDVVWKVSDSKGQYVTYEEDGGALILTPAGNTGSVTVTATANDGSKKAAKVTIKFVRLAQTVEIRNVPEYLLSGKSVTLTTDVASDKTLTSKTVLWSLSEASEPYATITSSGKLTVRQISEPMEIKVTAAVAGNPEAAQTVTIPVYPAVEAVQLSSEGGIFADGGKLTWDVGDGTLRLSAKCYPAGALQDGKWTVSNSSVAKISDDGVLTLLKAGTVKVTFTASDGSNKKATLNVTVTKKVASVIIAEPDPAEVRSGQTLTLSATAYAADGTAATNQKFGWYVWEVRVDSDGNMRYYETDVATVKNGKVTAKAVAENVQIIVFAWSIEYDGYWDEIQLTIRPKDDRVLNLYAWNDDETLQMIAPNEVVSLEPGDSFAVSAFWYFCEDAERVPVEDCGFTSSNAKAATIDPDGTVTAVNYGKTTITAKTTDPDTGKTVSAKFTVEVKNIAERVTIADPGTDYLRSGQSLNLKAPVWSDTSETVLATNQKVTWEVYEIREDEYGFFWLYDTDAATISNGKLSAKNVTENTEIIVYAVSADNDRVYDFFSFTIRPKQAYQMSIWVDDAPVTGTLSIPVDRVPNIDTQAMVYVSVPGDENDGEYVEVEDAVWTSSNSKTAAFDAEGNLAFKGTGNTTITAKCSVTVDGKDTVLSAKFSCKAVCSVNTLTISQKVPGALLFSGKTLQLAAAVNSDASNKKVTWTSSDPNVATVSASGVVKAGKVYQQTTVTITATAQDGFGETDSMELTIYPTATTVSILREDGYVLDNRTVTVSLSDCTSMELRALVYPSGDMGALQDVTWSSSSSAVAQCTDGSLTLKKAGSVTIKATANDGSKKTVSFKLVITN